MIQGSKGDRGEPGPPLNIKGTALSWVPDSNAKPGDVWILPDPLPTSTPAGFKAGGAAAWDDVAKRWIPLEAIRGPAGHSIKVFGPSPVPPPTADKGDIWLSSDSSLFSATFDPSGIKPIPGPAGAVGPAGPSAFESWKLSVSRPTASLKDFLDAIRGAAGSVGPKGAAGETLKVNGVVATTADLPKTPPLLTVNVTSDNGHLWVYDPASASANADGWNDLGKISGPAGAAAFISTAVTAVTALPAKGAAGQMIFVTDIGHLYGWDETAGAWVDGGKISDGSLDGGTVQGQMLVWDDTAKRWSAAAVLQLPTGTTDGDFPLWDDTNKRWAATPVKIPKTIADLDDVDDVIGNLGKDCVMVWDEVAQVWTDSRSIEIDDIEFDASGPGTLLEGIAVYADAGLDPTKDTWAPSCMAVDKYIRERINLEYLLDCNQLSAATNGQRPVWNDTTSRWEPQDPGYTKTEVDNKLTALVTGLEHEVSVLAIADTPPASPTLDQIYIVGATPTGAWAGQSNNLARWDGAAWVFDAPRDKEAHLVEAELATYSWNGTKWVKVAVASTAAVGNFLAITKADYTALATKDPKIIYLVHN